MVAASHRPLFVVHRATLGCDVYDICINNEDTMEVFLYRGSPLVEGLPYYGPSPSPPTASLASPLKRRSSFQPQTTR
jgi:hypothetical protein